VKLLESSSDVRRQLLQGLRNIHDATTLRSVAEYLGDPEPAVCEAAVSVLVQSGSPEAAEAAADRLRSTVPAERLYAISVLQRLGAVALGTLRALLDEADEDLRKYAVDALAAGRDTAAIPALIEALEDSDVNVAAAAAEGLGTIGSTDAIPALVLALRRGPDWVRISAVGGLGVLGGQVALEAICTLGDEAPASVLAAAAAAAGAAGMADPERTTRFLARLVAGSAAGVADAALIALGTLVQTAGSLQLDAPRRAAVVASATQRLAARRSDSRVAAIQVLANRTAPDAQTIQKIALLVWSDPSPAVRQAALRALEPLRGVERTELFRLAVDANEQAPLRRMALRMLGDEAMLDPDESSALVALARDESDLVLRLVALRLLLAVGEQRALELGRALLAEDDLANDPDVVAELAACALSNLLPLIRIVLESAELDHGRSFATLLPLDRAGDLSTPDAQSLLHAAVANPEWRVRAHALRLLDGCPAPWARELIQAGCADADPRVRVRAVEALGSGGFSSAEQALLCRRMGDESGWVRAGAYDALHRADRLDEAAVMAAVDDEFRPARRTGLVAALALARRGAGSGSFRSAARFAAELARLDEDPDLAALGSDLAGVLA
jgi:HEAT repeat protein